MRTTLGLLLLLVAGCDSSVPDTSPLVGTWALSSSETHTLVTSRTDQSIPDYSSQGDGGIAVSGTVTTRLSYISSVSRQTPGVELVTFVSERGPSDGFRFSFGVRRGFSDGATLSAQAEDSRETRYDLDGAVAFSYQDGQFTIPPVDLTTDDGSGGQVRVSGSLRLPLVALAAGQETVVEVERAVIAARVLTLRADGTFSQAEPGLPPSTGTWVADDQGEIELRLGGIPPDPSSQSRITYQIDGGTLRLAFANAASCTQECVPAYAADHYASPSSLSAVRTATTETYRRTTP